MINNFIDLIKNSASTYHSVEFLQKYLCKHGFDELKLEHKFDISIGGKYYVKKDSSIIAFKAHSAEDNFKIVASHVDSPSLKIKSNPDIISNGYNQLNVEVYGGPILSTWFDKPLSIAGIVTYLKEDVIFETLIDIKKPICIIPNLAIHMNRDVNSGVKIDKQKHLLPIISVNDAQMDKTLLAEIIGQNLNISKESILSYDLDLYSTLEPTVFGLKEEFILSPKLDNLSMALSSIEGLIQSNANKGIDIAICLDAEEIGSKTLNGGDSNFISNVLERIAIALNLDREAYLRSLENSYCISADLAHSVHPNYADKMDITNKPIINKGFVIKKNYNKRYATEAKLEAKIIRLAKRLDVPFQMFFNNSNEAGGSTIGPMISSNLPIKTIDIGNPILAMHSERETGGILDYNNIITLFAGFFGEEF